MKNISGYARILARIRVKEQLNKPFVGEPYIKQGQCSGIWKYFFQLGGMLGARHSNNLDAFGPAFLGMSGAPGVMENFFTEVAKRLVTDFSMDSLTFSDYVISEFTGRLGYTGDADRLLFLSHGMEKLAPDTVTELAWQYSSQGSALGAMHPQLVREMFERSWALVPEKDWQQARAFGLDIPAVQERIGYAELEEAEDGVFMDYCQRSYPDLYASLTS